MGELRQQIQWLLMVFCLLVFVVVFIAMLVSMWRQHRNGQPDSTNFHASIAVEICWALPPCAIVFLMVYPTVKAIFRV